MILAFLMQYSEKSRLLVKICFCEDNRFMLLSAEEISLAVFTFGLTLYSVVQSSRNR